MTDQPKSQLHAYQVGLLWEGGRAHLFHIVEVTEPVATAMAVAAAFTGDAPPQGKLVGLICAEIPLEWLRWAARTIEAGEDATAAVVRLASAAPDGDVNPGRSTPLGVLKWKAHEAKMQQNIGLPMPETEPPTDPAA